MAWSYLANISDKVEKSIELANSALTMAKGGSVDLDNLLKCIGTLSKHHLGFSHAIFSSEFGCPVESEIERKTIEFNGVEYPDYTWKCAFIVNDELFKEIQDGEINSFSFGGLGTKEVLFKIDED